MLRKDLVADSRWDTLEIHVVSFVVVQAVRMADEPAFSVCWPPIQSVLSYRYPHVDRWRLLWLIAVVSVVVCLQNAGNIYF